MRKDYWTLISIKRISLFTYFSKTSLLTIVLLLILNNFLQAQPDLIPYRKGKKWGYVNKEGERKISFKYRDAGIFCDGVAWVKKRRRYAYINEGGKKITSFKFREVENFENGFVLGSIKEITYSVSKQGELLKYNFPFCKAYGAIISFNKIFKIESKFGIVNKKVKDTLVKPIYDSLVELNLGSYAALKSSKWGLINSNGSIKTNFCFSKINSFCYDLILVEAEKKFGIIDSSGREIIPVVYDEIGETDYFTVFISDYFIVRRETKWGYVDRRGREASPIKYDKVLYFKGGLGRVLLNGKWGYIDSKGKEYFE